MVENGRRNPRLNFFRARPVARSFQSGFSIRNPIPGNVTTTTTESVRGVKGDDQREITFVSFTTDLQPLDITVVFFFFAHNFVVLF